MKTNFKPRLLTRSIMTLFSTKVEGNPHKRFPDAYYRRVYFTKPLFEGIEFLAICERKSKKKMANELMALGIARFMEERIHEYNIRVIAARELGQEPELTRFIIMLRRLAKSQGKHIDDFI